MKKKKTEELNEVAKPNLDENKIKEIVEKVMAEIVKNLVRKEVQDLAVKMGMQAASKSLI